MLEDGRSQLSEIAKAVKTSKNAEQNFAQDG